MQCVSRIAFTTNSRREFGPYPAAAAGFITSSPFGRITDEATSGKALGGSQLVPATQRVAPVWVDTYPLIRTRLLSKRAAYDCTCNAQAAHSKAAPVSPAAAATAAAAAGQASDGSQPLFTAGSPSSSSKSKGRWPSRSGRSGSQPSAATLSPAAAAAGTGKIPSSSIGSPSIRDLAAALEEAAAAAAAKRAVTAQLLRGVDVPRCMADTMARQQAAGLALRDMQQVLAEATEVLLDEPGPLSDAAQGTEPAEVRGCNAV
jgi:hypothetical protein